MNSYIEQAKVMSKGQITLPQEIRKLLGLNVGDRVSFIVNGDQVILANSSICALKLIQKEFEGEASNAGLYDEDDVQKTSRGKQMKVFLDTNILFSAILFPNTIPDKALQKAFTFHEAITCDYVLDELRRNIAKKFPNKMNYLDTFLLTLSMTIKIVKVSYEINDTSLAIRDPYDKPVLRAALESNCDVLITGDKDFLDSNIKNPKCIKAKDFLDNY